MWLIPFFGALSLAAGTVIERLSLKKKKIGIKLYQTVVFFAIVLVMIPFFPFFWNVSPDFYTFKNVSIFLAVIMFSILANIFAFYSMKWAKLSKIESARITEPLFVILLALIFSFIFGTELYDRNTNILIPAVIASLALIFSHFEKHHLKFSKYYLAAIIGSFFFAIELVISKLILDYFNPLTFYFLRCFFILILSFIIFKPKNYKRLNKKEIGWIFLTGALWVAYRVIIYFGYSNLGILETTLTIMLGPILVYFFAWKFLKNKLTWKNIVASVIVLLCVIYAIFA